MHLLGYGSRGSPTKNPAGGQGIGVVVWTIATLPAVRLGDDNGDGDALVTHGRTQFEPQYTSILVANNPRLEPPDLNPRPPEVTPGPRKSPPELNTGGLQQIPQRSGQAAEVSGGKVDRSPRAAAAADQRTIVVDGHGVEGVPTRAGEEDVVE